MEIPSYVIVTPKAKVSFFKEGNNPRAQKKYCSDSIEEYRTEVKVYSKCRHPNIIKMISHIDDERRLILELMNCSLERCMEFWDDREKYVLKLCMDVTVGVKCLHDNGFAHMDLYIKNILVTINSDGITAKICDMGMAVSEEILRMYNYGTVLVMPKEAFIPRENITMEICFGIDIWSIGCLFNYITEDDLESTLIHRLLLDRTNQKTIDSILGFTQEDIDKSITKNNNRISKLILSILRIDRTERPSLDTISKELARLSGKYIEELF